MNIEKRLERAEEQAGYFDLVIAVFEPYDNAEGRDLWVHDRSGQVFEREHLEALQEFNPHWVLWCRKPYHPEDDPFISDVPPEDWTEEMVADWKAKVELIEEDEPRREYEVVRRRLALGCSVKGYDERIIALAKESLGME